MLALVVLTLVRPSLAGSVSVGVDVLHEAMGIPGVDGRNVLLPPIHPGGQVEGSYALVDAARIAAGPALRLGGWTHAGVGGMLFATASARLAVHLPAHLTVDLEPVEAGLGLTALPGPRYSIGAAGLVEESNPPEARLLMGAGLGLSFNLPDRPVGLRVRYRAAVEYPALDALPVRWLPHSTLSLGVSWTLGGAGPVGIGGIPGDVEPSDEIAPEESP